MTLLFRTALRFVRTAPEAGRPERIGDVAARALAAQSSPSNRLADLLQALFERIVALCEIGRVIGRISTELVLNALGGCAKPFSDEPGNADSRGMDVAFRASHLAGWGFRGSWQNVRRQDSRARLPESLIGGFA